MTQPAPVFRLQVLSIRGRSASNATRDMFWPPEKVGLVNWIGLAANARSIRADAGTTFESIADALDGIRTNLVAESDDLEALELARSVLPPIRDIVYA